MPVNRITVLGGSGFVGSNLIVQLAKRAENVTVLTRRRQRFVSLKVLSNVTMTETDVHDDTALREAIRGSDAVVNLVGILNQSTDSGPHSFTGAHAELTRRLVLAALDTDVTRYLHMSALNADAENGSSEYLRSKGLAERHIHELAGAQLAYTIFRPSVIFGADDAFFNLFAGLIRAMPVFPLACPDAKMAPVYVGDVCKIMSESLNDPAMAGQTINLCGPDVFTLRELVEFTRDTMGLKRKVIGLPDVAARLQARIMEWLPGQPFSRDNYLSLQTDSVCPDSASHQPTSIHAIVPQYIGNTGTRSRQQKCRRSAGRNA